MSISKKDILDVISNMTVMEVVELVEAMEKKFNIKSEDFSIGSSSEKMSNNKNSIENTVEKTEFSLFMSNFGSNKIPVIKLVRSVTNLGLKEAKTLVESIPCLIKEKMSKEDAMKLKKQFDDIGALVEVK